MNLLDILTSQWAVTEHVLNEIVSAYQTHINGEGADIEGLAALHGRARSGSRQGPFVEGGVAVIDILGILAKNENIFMKIFGGTPTNEAGEQFRQAMVDPDVKAIILNIDSPGGTVDGTSELANLIFESRGRKPIIAFADGFMASAAFWIGAAADRILVSSGTASVGSVGIVKTHLDLSRRNEIRGIRVTEIVSGRLKGATSEHNPLSETGRGMIQRVVDDTMSVFVSDLAKFRGVSAEEIRAKLGEGQLFIGRQAVDAGVVDGFSTLDQLITELSQGDGNSRADRETSNLEKGVFMSKDTILAAASQKKPSKPRTLEQDIISKWKSDPGLAEEFTDLGTYAAYRQAVADGRVKENRQPKQTQAAESSKASRPRTLPVAEQAKTEWHNDPDLREEFPEVEEYIAAEKALTMGHAKVLSK